MKYEIRWKRSAERDLRSIDRQQVARIISAVDLLQAILSLLGSANFEEQNNSIEFA